MQTSHQSCQRLKKGTGIRQKTAASPAHEIVEIWSILLQITAQLQCTPFPTIRTAKSTTQTESRMKKVLAMKHVKWNSMYILKSFISNHQIAAPSFTVKSSCFISVNPFNRMNDDFRWLDIYLTNPRGLQKMGGRQGAVDVTEQTPCCDPQPWSLILNWQC